MFASGGCSPAILTRFWSQVAHGNQAAVLKGTVDKQELVNNEAEETRKWEGEGEQFGSGLQGPTGVAVRSELHIREKQS